MILALPGSQYLVAVERQRRAMIGVMIAVVVGAAANYVAIRAGWGLTGVAAATALGYVVYFLFVSAIPLGSELGAATAGRHLAMLALLIGPTLTAALLLPSVWPEALAVQSIAVVGAWAASLALGWHRGGWRKALQGRRVPGGTTASQGKLEAM
jgi:Na+-driven multidrug efflux pump